MNSNLRSRGEKIFGVFNAILMTLLALMCLLPLIHVLAVSLSDSASASANKVKFWPMGLNTAAYDMVFSNAVFLNSFGISVLRTVAGTAINLLMVILAAYPLSKDETELKGRNVIIWFFTIPMLISGGMIPSFLLVKNLGMMDSLWALILPGCVPTFYVIMMMNFIRGISKSISEAAAIDGASPWRRFRTIIFPLLSPTSFFLLVVNTIYTLFETFGIVHAVTQGGPSRATETLIYKVFNDGFIGLDFGGSSAQSVVLMLIVMVLTFLQFRYVERKVTY